MNSSSYFRKNPEALGVVLLTMCLSQFLSIATFTASSPHSNFLGLFGHFCALFWIVLFGFSSLVILAAFSFLAFRSFWEGREVFSKKNLFTLLACGLSFALFLTTVSSLLPQIEECFRPYFGFEPSRFPQFFIGGTPCHMFFHHLLKPFINTSGSLLLSSLLLGASLIAFFDYSLHDLLRLFSKAEKKPNKKPEKEVRSIPKADLFCDIEAKRPTIEIVQKQLPKELPLTRVLTCALARGEFNTPPLDILNNPKKHDLQARTSELKQKATLLEETLLSFGIEAKVGQVHCGPTIASFEVHPASGVKIGKIKTLENDIALNLEAKSLRIIAPIPGKAAVGIEVPHSSPQEVSFKELLLSYLQQGAPLKIPMLLGKAVNGDMVISDLAKMPHCIIAGATGSGKSVCLNTIVMSILMTRAPEEIRLLMIDPKKVELTPYSELPHMLAPVITEPHVACSALGWLVKEMERRYEILKITGQRNIEAFNKRKVNEEVEKNSHIPIPATFAYYVAIVDELADLMMVASQDIETPIARIAQMARAVGIHLILATQRPSREVITGLIRANFPARIAFKVASRVNSQIILDETGAETLLGNGDMLFLIPGSSQLVRAQGAFIRDEEINRVIEHITRKFPPQYLITSFESMVHSMQEGEESGEDADSLYGEAKSIVLSTGNASTTFLQRKLKIGYARAASLMDLLESKGVVGPQEGSKPRKVFLGKQSDDDEDFE
jgi:DNA segregation ATPase FtsK/SpoIIIE-like protein